VKGKDNLLSSCITNKPPLLHNSRRILAAGSSILNEQDEHGDRERRTRKGEEKIVVDIFRVDGATFPPFFPLSFFVLFSLLLPPSPPPFRGDLKVFQKADSHLAGTNMEQPLTSVLPHLTLPRLH
jgi:hypothetical protein